MTVWSSAADLARLYAVPVGTIHRWASEDGWPRVGTGRYVRYDTGAADASYQSRRAA